MAAAARAPGPADARTPCPLCGGLIHPIAGRCKHCKGDLSALRSARPAAAAALPALQAAPIAAAPVATVPDPYAIAHGHGNGHAPHVPHAPRGYQPQPNVPLPVQVAHAAAAYAQVDVAHAILPPRPTGRMPATPARSAWKSWPVIVIILAVIAIVTAVVLMVWPPSSNADPGVPGKDQPMPAPERMDMNPSPTTPAAPKSPSSSTDPWSNRGTSPPGHQPAPDIDDPNLQDPRDPFSRRGGLGTGTLGAGGNFLVAMMSHACERFTQCGNTDRMLKLTCDAYTKQMPRAAPPTCDAAQRCLDHIDSLDCDANMNDTAALVRLTTQFSDCAEALSC